MAVVTVAARMNGGSSKPNGTEPEGKGDAPKTSKPFEFRPEEVIKAVRSGDIAKMQTTATELVQHKWKEEYTLPAACVVVFLVSWYWVAWTRRSVRRKCAAMVAATRQEAAETVKLVHSLTEKWGKDITKSNEHMKAIIEKNSALTADIDRMTAALRSCSIRPTPNSPQLAARPRADEGPSLSVSDGTAEVAQEKPTRAA